MGALHEKREHQKHGTKIGDGLPAMTALFVAWYKYCCKHETLRGRTPAMASGLAEHVWSIEELLDAVK